MPVSDIEIRGAREHNLKNVDASIPRNKLICLTGVSGSGKSSLAFDTLFAEGQRRYVESLANYARHLIGQMPKPDVDFMGGLSPSIAISQKSTGYNPRSTVGTITEIYDYLRILYARVGQGHCPQCDQMIASQSRDQVIAQIMQTPVGEAFMILSPLIRRQKGEHQDLFSDLLKQGFVRVRVDGEVVSLNQPIKLNGKVRHDVDVVIDRFVMKPDLRPRLAEAVELGIRLGQGTVVVAYPSGTNSGLAEAAVRAPSITSKRSKRSSVTETEVDDSAPTTPSARPDKIFSTNYSCSSCGISFEPPTPQLFSFNSPQGMCPGCMGMGEVFSFDEELLIPDRSKSFKQGCVELLGPWKDMGRWRRHLFQGVADTMEKRIGLEQGQLLETPWESLAPDHQKIWLLGTGTQHITYTWRDGANPIKHGGIFHGIVADLNDRYRQTEGTVVRAQLEKYMRTKPCTRCEGARLLPQARAVRIRSGHTDYVTNLGHSLPEVCRLSIKQAAEFFTAITLDEVGQIIATEVLKEIRGRLGFLLNVGLEYLTLDRTAPTLSGGETQRIRLASQIGAGLVGVTYVLDEPSIGLHPRDNVKLLESLKRLRDLGNTVVVVEHDEETIRESDHVMDFGPGPGVRGGKLIAAGPPSVIADCEESVTGKFLSHERRIDIPQKRRSAGEKLLRVVGATQNNLKNVTVEIPLGVFVCVTGVSGSGKSSLVNDILIETLHRDLNGGEGHPGAHEKIEGMEFLDKLISIDQTPIGRTPRSNPATYIKLWDEIRDLFSKLPDSKRRGFAPGRFSFNVEGGRCEACEGNGSNRLDMDFLSDIWVKCPVCEGNRFNRETLQVRFKGKSIADVLEMDVQQALELFENVPGVHRKLQTMHDVGLDYLHLGQPSPTLSGGEAQRIKLARELSKRSTGKTLYLLDEPTTGLHFADVDLLLKVLHGFVEAGNTVLVIEHNLDVIKTADHVIDLGPEGGSAGGRVIATGTPEEIAKHPESHTGKSLAPVIAPVANGANGSRGKSPNKTISKKGAKVQRESAPGNSENIVVRGAKQHNLKDVSCQIPREKLTVFSGPSGSGKSSLAIDTIYAEGQRRYVESLSAYARQFVSQSQKPVVDQIEGLSPAIAIEQKNLGHTPRSTVGTVTEVYDYFRILMARLGERFCPQCDRPVSTQTTDQIVDKILAGERGAKLYLMAPMPLEEGQSYEELFTDLRSRGYQRVRIDGVTHDVDSTPAVDRRRKRSVEVVVDRITVNPDSRSRIAGSVEQALDLGKGVVALAHVSDSIPEPKWRVERHSQLMVCDPCGLSFDTLAPQNFSFNTPLGWCPACEGLGSQIGANASGFIRNPGLSLLEGAISAWPNPTSALARSMIVALGKALNLPIDKPYETLSPRERRAILHGMSEEWIDALDDSGNVILQFQYKGLFPALEEASRISPRFRLMLEQHIGEVECSVCFGSRIRRDAGAVRFRGKTLQEYCQQSLGSLHESINEWNLSARDKQIAGEILREITSRTQFLNDIGLNYLSLARPAASLSNGEAQRIRLASQLGSGLCGVLYVLDEPTIGLHPRDNERLLRALRRLRDLGNTLLIVEHDREVIENADHVLDFGPGAGRHGGQIVASAPPNKLSKIAGSVSGPYLSGDSGIAIPSNRRPVRVVGASSEQTKVTPEAPKPIKKKKAKAASLGSADLAKNPLDVKEPKNFAGSRVVAPAISILGASEHNLRNVNVHIPLGTLTAITGSSGSGKSTLVEDILYAALARSLHRAALTPGRHEKIEGLGEINKVIRVDQQALGNSPASNPATYTGVFDLVRELFSQLPDAKVRGYSARRFSFNVPGGRCEACEGNGQRRIEMHFLPDIWVTCEICRGHRYNPETLAVKYRDRSINDLLEMPCLEALKLFENIPKIRRIIQTLCDVGLDYVNLGQAAPTLSGGEAQRVKLAAELARPDTGRTLYLLDEPSTGLHFRDLEKLLVVLHRLVDVGNTVVVIEHNLDVIKSADWVIDVGPEGGSGGGNVVASGTPEEIVAYAKFAGAKGNQSLFRSYTGEALVSSLEKGPYRERAKYQIEVAEPTREGDLEIEQVGEGQKMPWETDGRKWHTVQRVGRRGEPTKWDGAILSKVVDRIHELGEFGETNWNHRSVVEICGTTKSMGWFFHAITGEAWLLKMKFRVAKGTFRRETIEKQIELKTLNQLEDLPVYGNEPRVQVRSAGGPWQEIEIRAHTLAEIDTPAFWGFLAQAVAGFQQFFEEALVNKEEIAPWKVLGQKWHLLRKGFPPGKKVAWHAETLTELLDLLHKVCPSGQFLWNNQQIVHLIPTGQRRPWVSILTKKPHAVVFEINAPRDQLPLGRLLGIGAKQEVERAPEGDVARIDLVNVEQIRSAAFVELLRTEAARVQNLAEKSA